MSRCKVWTRIAGCGPPDGHPGRACRPKAPWRPRYPDSALSSPKRLSPRIHQNGGGGARLTKCLVPTSRAAARASTSTVGGHDEVRSGAADPVSLQLTPFERGRSRSAARRDRHVRQREPRAAAGCIVDGQVAADTPPCCRPIHRAIARPRPLPPRPAAPRPNGSKRAAKPVRAARTGR